MRVIATDQGYDNIKVREPGEEFDMPDGAKGKWFKPVAPVAQPESKDGSKTDKNAGSDLV